MFGHGGGDPLMNDGYPPDWDTRRKKVYRRDGYQCCNCGVYGGPKGEAELHCHHIVPKGRGGSHDDSNLITTCEPCHSAIHNKGVMAPTADETHTPSVNPLETAREARRSYRKVKRIMRLFK